MPNNKQKSKPNGSENKAENAQPEVRVQTALPSNYIFVGKKPTMSYAMSALIRLAQEEGVFVKARGMSIGRAVDVAEILTKRLSNGTFRVRGISIDTEVVGEGNEKRNVSSIQIEVGK